MSRSKNKKRPGYARLLDSWTPPEGAGEAVGCLATSFTFQSDFFEEECLSRFVGMESDPEEDGAVYLIEREEKLAALKCAAVLVDRHNCRGTRSLRWDLLTVRVPGGILHAKITLLYWTNLLRVVVSSANITKQGYGLNREIFGVLDLGPGAAGPKKSVLEILAFLRSLVTRYAESAGRNPASLRCRALLEEAEDSAKKWDIREYNGRSATNVYPLLVSPGRRDAFASLKGLWPDSSPPKWAFVTSPFFDPPESENLPAKAIWKLLSQRGEAEVTYNVLVDKEGTSDVLCIRAPESLREAEPRGRNRVNTIFAEVPQTEATQDNGGDKRSNSKKSTLRPLHMKSIWLKNERSALYMVGSSNFTSAGLGLSRTPNVEANLVYVVDIKRNKKAYKRLDRSYLYGEEIDEATYQKITWNLTHPEGEDMPGTQDETLPEAFGQAVYYNDGEKARVELSFVGEPPPGWLLMLDDSEEVFFGETRWNAKGAPRKNVCLDWTRPQPPSGFTVTWEGSKGKAWWPVVASGPESLPPPDKLKDLTLEDLIGILGSSRSLHQSMRRLLKKKEREGLEVNPVLDPHKRVDTSSFVLQRTRRFSWALHGIRTRLEGTLPTLEALKWQLYGPVGVLAFGEAIIREAKNDDERAFLLSELALKLSRVKPNEMDNGLGAEVVKKEIRNVIGDLRKKVPTDAVIGPQMKAYVREAFLEALR